MDKVKDKKEEWVHSSVCALQACSGRMFGKFRFGSFEAKESDACGLVKVHREFLIGGKTVDVIETRLKRVAGRRAAEVA